MPALPTQLGKPTLAMLPRVVDQLGFLYIEAARIEKDDNGVSVLQECATSYGVSFPVASKPATDGASSYTTRPRNRGFKLSTVGQGRREITDHEGLQLVTHRSAGQALWTTAEAARP